MASKEWLSLLVLAACGPDVAATDGADTSSAGSSTSPTDTADAATAMSITVGDPSSADGADSSTGEPTNAHLCWSSTWARAKGVSRAWTDGEAVIAAADESLLLLADGVWREEHLEDTQVLDITARFPDDAWLMTRDSVLHWDGVAASVDLTVPGGGMGAIGLAPDGVLWAVYRPDSDCVGLCKTLPSEVQIREADGTWTTLDSPGIEATALAFTATSTWLGGYEGELLRKDGDGPWIEIESPILYEVERMWPWGDGLLVAGSYEIWRYVDDAWTLELEHDFFSGARGFARGAGGDDHLLYSAGIAGEIDRTGELRRWTPEGWVTTATLDADRELVALDDGRLVAFGDERGHLVQVIDDPSGAATVSTVLQRTDVGDTTAFAITGDGALVGVDETAIQIEGIEGWTSADDNSIYGRFRAAGGPRVDDVTLVSSELPPLWHFDGQALSPIPFVQPQDATITLNDLWMADSGEMFAVGGREGVFGWPHDPAILRFDGDTWVEVPAPDAPCEAGCMQAVEGYGDALVVAGEGVWERASDGWVDITPFPNESGSHGSLAVGPHGVWVTVYAHDEYRLLQRTGDAWIDHTDALPVVEEVPRRMVVDDDTHVWVAWGESLARFDGSTWTEIQVPEPDGWTPSAMIVAPGPRLVVHTERKIWSGVPCEG